MKVHRAHQDVADDLCDKPTRHERLGLALQEQGHRCPTLYQVMKIVLNGLCGRILALPLSFFQAPPPARKLVHTVVTILST
jgi:hypothetical protein